MTRRVGKITGWPLWCDVCKQIVRCKGDIGCTEKPVCTSYWIQVSTAQRLAEIERAKVPGDPAYEAGVWPPRARRT